MILFETTVRNLDELEMQLRRWRTQWDQTGDDSPALKCDGELAMRVLLVKAETLDGSPIYEVEFQPLGSSLNDRNRTGGTDGGKESLGSSGGFAGWPWANGRVNGRKVEGKESLDSSVNGRVNGRKVEGKESLGSSLNGRKVGGLASSVNGRANGSVNDRRAAKERDRTIKESLQRKGRGLWVTGAGGRRFWARLESE